LKRTSVESDIDIFENICIVSSKFPEAEHQTWGKVKAYTTRTEDSGMDATKEQWTEPTLTELDIADETQVGDGPTTDLTDPAPQS